jgi:hypothetical protein
MAFNKRLDSIFPGMGQPLRNDALFLRTGVIITTAGSPNATTLPAAGVLIPTTTTGRIRVKIYKQTVAVSVTSMIVTATDGTNTVLVAQGALNFAAGFAITATAWLEFEFEYILDVASSGAGGGATGQLSGLIGGATAFTISPTLTGAGGSCSMDLELAPLV